MARPKKKLDLETVEEAKEELKKIKDGKTSIQLKAIIAASEHAVDKVAEVMQVSYRSIFKWIDKFKTGGIEGLKDKPKGHMRAKLTKEHLEKIEQWIISGKNADDKAVHWTLKRLRKEIKKEFGISIGKTPLWKHLKKMDLVLKKPRPTHVKADKEKQETFKKKLK